MKETKFGIVILNYNTARETIECIESIEKYTIANHNIYVVDNNSQDESLKLVGEKYNHKENVFIIANKENKGYSAGNNIGIKRAIEDKCNIIFIINSDVELLNDALDKMNKTLLSDESFMMVGPSVKDNKQREAQIPREKLTLKKFVLGRHPFCDIPILSNYANRIYTVSQEQEFSFDGSVSGCCFGMRANDFKRIGFFDENVFLYSEEDILAYKMHEIGKKAVLNKEASVWHKENVSTKKEGSAFIQFHRWSSVLYLLKNYVRINFVAQIIIALWNTLTWSIISVYSRKHRQMLREFWKKNWQIVFTHGRKVTNV